MIDALSVVKKLNIPPSNRYSSLQYLSNSTNFLPTTIENEIHKESKYDNNNTMDYFPPRFKAYF